MIGVVKDVKYRDLRTDADAMLYVPILQTTSTSAMTLHALVDDGATALAAAIRRELQAIDPALPAFGIRTVDDQVNAFLAQPRQAAALTGGFGLLALSSAPSAYMASPRWPCGGRRTRSGSGSRSARGPARLRG